MIDAPSPPEDGEQPEIATCDLLAEHQTPASQAAGQGPFTLDEIKANPLTSFPPRKKKSER